MKLQSKANLIYLEEVERTSQAGNQYTQVKLADTEAYENFTFFKTDTVNTDGLKKSDKVQVLLEVTPQGYNNRLNLVQINKL